MDSKQLYRLYQRNDYLSNWFDSQGEIAQSDGEICWTYCGLKDDFKKDVVEQAIGRQFVEDEVYFCGAPNRSRLIPKSMVISEIRDLINKKEIGIMNKDCTKIMYFSSIGVFKSGIIRDYPKSRERVAGTPLKVEFHANVVNSKTSHVGDILYEPFELLEKDLRKDYGGLMEHLWIDVELVESDKPWPFRFQKRVDVPDSFNEVYSYNVGHYSIEPDYEKLLAFTNGEEICAYIFDLLYCSIKVLEDNKKKLGDFNTAAFREDFLISCQTIMADMGQK